MKEIHFTSTPIFMSHDIAFLGSFCSVSAVGQASVVNCEDSDLLKVKTIPKCEFGKVFPHYFMLLLDNI